jgi:GT2 family glycosyltransferase
MSTVLDIHVLVVAYGKADDLDRCLSALAEAVPITVVDNSSSPEVAAVSETHGATYVDAGGNLGFAAAVNAGVASIAAPLPAGILLVNPDALVSPACIRSLADALSTHRRAAAVAPRLVDEQGASERVAWPFPSPWRAWLEAVGLGRIGARRTFVIGAVLLVRSAALEEVGPFDERFFLYAEETDWLKRAAQLGWTSVVVPSAIAVHRGAGSSDDDERREALFYAGQETYVRKWYGGAGWAVFRLGAALGALARALLLRGPRREAARRRVRLYVQGPRRVAGFARERA